MNNPYIHHDPKLEEYINCIFSGRPTKECLSELRGFDEFGDKVGGDELDTRLDVLINDDSQ